MTQQTINGIGTLTINASASSVTYIPPLTLGGPLSAPMSIACANNFTTASGKRKGWPLKHSRRAAFYRRPILRMYYSLQSIVANNKVNPILSEYESAELEKMKSKLAELYNNRFEEYYKMMCDERNVEYHPRNKVNKFILE